MEAKPFTHPVIRLLRLWKVHAYLDLMWMLRDTKHFLICYLSDVFISLASVTAMFLLAERFNGIGQWSKPQIIFLLGYGTILAGLSDIFFGYNVLCISRRVGRGQFDHTLIQPQPVWMTLLTEGFTPVQNSARLLPGLILIGWSLHYLPVAVTPEWVGLFLINIAGSCAVTMSFAYLWGSLAFWAPRSAEEVSSAAMSIVWELKIFPLVGLGSGMVAALLTVLPVGFVAWYPCQALLGIDPRPWSVIVTPAAGVVFAAIGICAFKRGMKHYAKTGSQRYLGWGHRS